MSNPKDDKSMGSGERKDKDPKTASDRPGAGQREQSTGQRGAGQQGGHRDDHQHGGQQGGTAAGDPNRKPGKT